MSLKVDPSTFVAIEGPSGSGKSTMLHLMGCLDQPTSGRVLLWGEDVGRKSDRELSALRSRRMGFVFQSHNLIPVLTAAENLEYPLHIAKVPAGEARRRARDLLEAVGLADQADQRPGELSGGQCQRVAVARALVGRPDLVLADEPTASLDSVTGEGIVALMAAMVARFGTTFVVATHDPMVAAKASCRIHIKDGHLVSP